MMAQSIELPSLVCTYVCSLVLTEGVSLLFPTDEYMQLSVEVRKSKKDSAHSGKSPHHLPLFCFMIIL